MQITTTAQKYFTLDQILQDIPEIDKEEIVDIEATYESYKSELNYELKTTDKIWLEFQAGQCEQYGKAAKSILYRIVKSSVNEPENSIAAANAITILKVMNVSFSYLDLEGIKIPKADLSEAILDRANLTSADLTQVILKNASLNQAKMKKTILKGVDLGIENFINFEEYVYFICFSHEYNKMLIRSMLHEDEWYIWDINSNECIVVEIELKSKNKIDFNQFYKPSFISNNKISALYKNDSNEGYKVFIIDFILNPDRLIFNQIPIELPKEKYTVTSIFRDRLIFIKKFDENSSQVSLKRFDSLKERYEEQYTVNIPYKINTEPLSIIIFSPTQSFFVISVRNTSNTNICVIFDYETASIASCIELDTPFSEAVFSHNAKLLAVKQNEKVSFYECIRNDISTTLFVKKIFDDNDNFDKYGPIEFICNDKYIAYVVEGLNSLKILDIDKQKIFYFSYNFSFIEFYSLPSISKVILCGYDRAQIVSIDDITPNVLQQGRYEFHICSDKDGVMQTLYSMNKESIETYSIAFSNLQLIRSNSIEFHKSKDQAYSEVKFSYNALYIIATEWFENYRDTHTRLRGARPLLAVTDQISNVLSIRKKISLFNCSNGKLFYIFPDTYFCFVLSSNDTLAVCITENYIIQVWHLPSKKKVYELENYTFDEFLGFAAISENYIALQHSKYIKVISLQNKLAEFSRENFFDVNSYTQIVTESIKSYISMLSFYGQDTLILENKSKIHIYDLTNSSNKREIDLSKLEGKVIGYDVSIKKGLVIVYSHFRKNNAQGVASLALFDINNGKMLDKVKLRGHFDKIRFSTNGDYVIGYHYSGFEKIRLWIWHIQYNKLIFTYKNLSLFEAYDINTSEFEAGENLQRVMLNQYEIDRDTDDVPDDYDTDEVGIHTYDASDGLDTDED